MTNLLLLRIKCKALLEEIGKEMRNRGQANSVPNHQLILAMKEVYDLVRE